MVYRFVFVKIDPKGVWQPSNCKWVTTRKTTDVLDITILRSENMKGPGVYKFIFSNGKFYIGSTGNLLQRAQLFRYTFNTGRIHNKKMAECVKECHSATFEVLKETKTADEARKVEGSFLVSFIGDDQLINRSFDAYSNKGVKWTEEEISKTRDKLKGRKYSKTGGYRPKGEKLIFS